MKAFYEGYRSNKSGYAVDRHGKSSYPSHFHGNVELFIVVSGSCDVTMDGKVYSLDSGSVLFIESYSVHSYGDSNGGEQYVLIIPSEYMREFNRARANAKLKNPLFHGGTIARDIADIIAKHLSGKRSEYELFAAFNAVLLLIYENAEFSDQKNGNESELIIKMLSYAEEHFKENVSLKSMSALLGYTEGHLSRVFHQYVDESFPKYLSRLRLEYVEKQSESGEKINALVYDAGFGSLQSYYRAKKAISQC